MSKKYLLGVDGGGTKAEYLLFDDEGNFMDFYRGGRTTNSSLPGGYEETASVIEKSVKELLDKNNITMDDISAAAFGLGGIDTEAEKELVEGLLRDIGFKNFVLNNDSYIGIKAGCKNGVGICSILGTGTVVAGVDSHGKELKIGGLGLATGDLYGGYILPHYVIKAVYDKFYRCGKDTILEDSVMKILEVKEKEELFDAINQKLYKSIEYNTPLTISLFDAANKGDEVAVAIVEDMADNLARGVSGCILNLNFDDVPTVVLLGSVWVKSQCELFHRYFAERIKNYTGIDCNIKKLMVIPAVGAIIWASELLGSNKTFLEKLNTEIELNSVLRVKL